MNARSCWPGIGHIGRVPVVLAIMALTSVQAIAELTVSNVRASQRAGTTLVDIYYDLSGVTPPVFVSVQASNDGGETYAVSLGSVTGDLGSNVSGGKNRKITWNAGADWDRLYSDAVKFRIKAIDSSAPAAMVLIPPGSFEMGNPLYRFEGGGIYEGYGDEVPVHTVTLSAFYVDKYEVRKAQWDEIYAWAVAHDYGFESRGSGKEANHPVQSVYWYDCVKWCNARSEMEGLVPCYTVEGSIYKTGRSSPDCDRSANGYRLPTEAEWEKAARGGLVGKRFPWGDTISRSMANYHGITYGYDLGPDGWNPLNAVGGYPWTSAVGSSAVNGYGLYDMAGNVWEWCNDLYSYYQSGPVTDPLVSASDWSDRVFRGGSWFDIADYSRVAYRGKWSPDGKYYTIGFRVVRSAAP